MHEVTQRIGIYFLAGIYYPGRQIPLDTIHSIFKLIIE